VGDFNLQEDEAGSPCTFGEGTMSATLFLALCILGIDFMIYALFQWSYGDKRKAIERQVAAHRNAAGESRRPFLVAAGFRTQG
jgi:hypothetical protein